MRRHRFARARVKLSAHRGKTIRSGKRTTTSADSDSVWSGEGEKRAVIALRAVREYRYEGTAKPMGEG